MSSTEPDPRVLAGVTVSSLASVAIALAAGAVVVWACPTPGLAGAASLAFALTAVTCFATAIVQAVSTGRLAPALWGYLPGLLCVLAAGLWMSESARAAGSAVASPWLGALVGLNPAFWVPIVVLVGLATHRRRQPRRTCRRPRIR